MVLYLANYFFKDCQVLRIDGIDMNLECLIYGLQIDESLVNRLFFYFNKHSAFLDKMYDNTICAIIAVIVIFAPDRGYNFAQYNALAGKISNNILPLTLGKNNVKVD